MLHLFPLIESVGTLDPLLKILVRTASCDRQRGSLSIALRGVMYPISAAPATRQMVPPPINENTDSLR